MNERNSLAVIFCGILVNVLAQCDGHETTLNPELVSAQPRDEDSCHIDGIGNKNGCTSSAKKEADDKVLQLVQLEGVKVGNVRHLELVDGQTHQLITRSLKPLMFEIPNFLSGDECDYIIGLAKDKGLEESRVLDASSEQETNEPPSEVEHIEHCSQLMKNYDMNDDGQISFDEFKRFFDNVSAMVLEEKDASIIFRDLKFDKDGDGLITHEECLQVNLSAVDKFVSSLEEDHPFYRSRFSQSTWFEVDRITDPVLRSLQERILKMTKLPRQIVEESESLQVVRYSVRGHFHAHYDSSKHENNGTEPRCTRSHFNDLCRFVTILYYLNDVPRGGETAFPVADNATFNETEYEMKGLSNLSSHCHLANVVVKPRKGTAILWYNHHIDPDTGLLGPMDVYSVHGGCDVLDGVKWIANNWINAPYKL